MFVSICHNFAQVGDVYWKYMDIDSAHSTGMTVEPVQVLVYRTGAWLKYWVRRLQVKMEFQCTKFKPDSLSNRTSTFMLNRPTKRLLIFQVLKLIFLKIVLFATTGSSAERPSSRPTGSSRPATASKTSTRSNTSSRFWTFKSCYSTCRFYYKVFDPRYC